MTTRSDRYLPTGTSVNFVHTTEPLMSNSHCFYQPIFQNESSEGHRSERYITSDWALY